MKSYKIFAALALSGLCACSTQLSKQDNDRIANIQRTAEEAKNQSQEALDNAAHAQKTADRAAAKADRIFKESQNK